MQLTESDYYDIVRKKLSIGQIRAAKHEKIFELMKIFWDEKTIEILSYFPSVGKLISLKELAEKTGKDKSEIKKILKNAVKKKTLAKAGRSYGLVPLLPGIFEAYYIAREDTEENLKKAAKIYRYMFENANEFQEIPLDKKAAIFSPILPVEATQKLIEIDKSVDLKGTKVVSKELVEEMINKNDTFAVIPCQCRLIAEYNGEPCKVAPAEMGCFVVGLAAKALASMGKARALKNKEEAFEYIRKTEEAGLVHNAANDPSENTFICNCCSCHCGALAPMKKFNIPHVRPSNFIPKYNQELCISCQTCLDHCQMEAISITDDDKMKFNYELCIGCGVCASNCSENAIKMEKVRDEHPPERGGFGDKTFGELLSGLFTS